ncbi:hypothetical protein BDF14DRAFT_683277 [Spinellus fusiger]|nr:hypothetical protein BDF14DRAFT_683277 [Spinellus fusiger]
MKDKTLKLWNRDLAATLNFRHSLMSQREKAPAQSVFADITKESMIPKIYLEPRKGPSLLVYPPSLSLEPRLTN